MSAVTTSLDLVLSMDTFDPRLPVLPFTLMLVEVLLKVSSIHDAVLNWLGAVKDELVLDLLLGTSLALSRGLFGGSDNHFAILKLFTEKPGKNLNKLKLLNYKLPPC